VTTKITFSKRSILWCLLFALMLVPILAPHYFLEHAVIGAIIDIWVYASLLLMALFCICRLSSISVCIWLPLLSYVVLLVSTIANGNSSIAVLAVVKHGIKVLLLCCLVECLMDDKNRLDCFLRTVRNITLFFFLLNMVANVVYPKGIPSITNNLAYPFFIYGNVNSTIRMVLPGMCCASILDFRRGRHLSIYTWLFVIGFAYTFVCIYPITTTMLAVVAVMVWMLFANRLWKKTQQIYMIVLCVVFLLEIFVVVLANTNVTAFIAGLFNKSSDLTGRAILWNNAISCIVDSPLLGHGRQLLTEIKMAIGLETGCHNYFLDVMYQRGVVGIVLLMILIVKPIINMKTKQLSVSTELYVLMGYCVALLMMFFAEPFFEYECYFIPIFYSVFLLTSKKKAKHMERRRGMYENGSLFK